MYSATRESPLTTFLCQPLLVWVLTTTLAVIRFNKELQGGAAFFSSSKGIDVLFEHDMASEAEATASVLT